MIPIAFPEQNVTWAKDQQPYLPLPAHSDGRSTISCWSFTWAERLRLLVTGHLWIAQLNFGRPLQPIKPQASSPFEV